ncbi:MAG: hypothetical protein VCD33_00560 [Alphaproteobacteria bacterium]
MSAGGGGDSGGSGGDGGSDSNRVDVARSGGSERDWAIPEYAAAVDAIEAKDWAMAIDLMKQVVVSCKAPFLCTTF